MEHEIITEAKISFMQIPEHRYAEFAQALRDFALTTTALEYIPIYHADAVTDTIGWYIRIPTHLRYSFVMWAMRQKKQLKAHFEKERILTREEMLTQAKASYLQIPDCRCHEVSTAIKDPHLPTLKEKYISTRHSDPVERTLAWYIRMEIDGQYDFVMWMTRHTAQVLIQLLTKAF